MALDTATYYDRLAWWTALAQPFGYGGGRRTLTVHRALADPLAGGRPTATRVHDLLIESLPQLHAPRVLDAGCGLGGTMIDLARRIGGTFTGLTVSAEQAAIGRAAVARAGLERRVDIQVGSYDDPPAGPFDLVVAIESLAHSADPAATVRAWAARLAPRGTIAIVDDMPDPDAGHSNDLAAFKSGWRLPVLATAAHLAAALCGAGLAVVTDRDLSAYVRPRSLGKIRSLQTLNRIVRACAPSEGFRAVLDSHHGGLALERLYRHGAMRYRLLIARRS